MAKTEYTQEEINEIVRQAQEAAHRAAMKFFTEKLGGRDQYACGFAATRIYSVKASTKLGRALKAAGVKKNEYAKAFEIWNPSGMSCQNIDTLEEGAEAAARVFRKYGFEASAWSRLD